MTKADFVDAIAKRLDLPKKVAAEAVDAFTAEVTALLKKGDKLVLPGFGSFSVASRAARTGRNPSTGQEIKIAASKSGKFSAGKDLKGI